MDYTAAYYTKICNVVGCPAVPHVSGSCPLLHGRLEAESSPCHETGCCVNETGAETTLQHRRAIWLALVSQATKACSRPAHHIKRSRGKIAGLVGVSRMTRLTKFLQSRHQSPFDGDSDKDVYSMRSNIGWSMPSRGKPGCKQWHVIHVTAS